MRRRPASVLALLASLALLAAACSGAGDDTTTEAGGDGEATTSTADAGEPQEGGTLVYGLSSETNNWDPTVANWSNNGWTVAYAVFDTLMAFDEDFELKPYLAESFEPNEDHTVWTITPRESVTFHNGEPLDAETIAMNIQRHFDSPLTGSVFEPVESMEVVDGTVQITLEESWVNFPITFTNQPGIMVAPEMIENPDGGSNPIGTGPFVFDDWIPDDQLTVTRNDDYWNGAPYLDGVEFRVITDHTTRATALETGELDAALISLANDLVDFQEEAAEGEYQILAPEGGEESEVFFLPNLEREPFDDQRVREAMALAIDRERLIETLREGLYEPADGIYPPDSPWYVETDYPEFDPERARELVDEWEAETGEDLSVTLGSPQEASTLEAMQAVQAQWEEVGIDVDIKTLEATQYISDTLSGNYEVNVWQYYAAPHPDGEYVWLHSDFAAPEGQLALNFGRIRDDEIDAALEEARGIEDVERQRELYGQIQEVMAEQVYHVFLYHDFSAVVAQDFVHGVMDWTFADGTPGSGMVLPRPRLDTTWMSLE